MAVAELDCIAADWFCRLAVVATGRPMALEALAAVLSLVFVQDFQFVLGQ